MLDRLFLGVISTLVGLKLLPSGDKDDDLHNDFKNFCTATNKTCLYPDANYYWGEMVPGGIVEFFPFRKQYDRDCNCFLYLYVSYLWTRRPGELIFAPGPSLAAHFYLFYCLLAALRINNENSEIFQLAVVL